MNITDEQRRIIECKGNQQINAVAGSGKTTTLMLYAKARPHQSGLYLVFNKSMKEEALRKFSENGVTNVQCETAHSLAYRSVMRGSKYRLRNNNYNKIELLHDLYDGEVPPNKYAMILMTHILKCHAIFCGSNAERVDQIKYASYVKTSKALEFVQQNINPIMSGAERLWEKQLNGEIEVNHDFYLKKYQLSNPSIGGFDFIMYDEGQDASMVMLDTFIKQKNAVKIIVGDTFQQIYSWRFSVNAFSKLGYTTNHLSKTFRFGRHIAEIAKTVVGWREQLGVPVDFRLEGTEHHKPNVTTAVISRSNLSLLEYAIHFTTENPDTPIHFIGGFAPYTYATGASMYDVLSLKNGRFSSIRDATIKTMKSYEELIEFATETEDSELKTLISLVDEYGSNLPNVMNAVRDRHVEAGDHVVNFTTTHKAKGFEFDKVVLTDSFIGNDEIIELLVREKPLTSKEIALVIEELNLLYVACTRARTLLVMSPKHSALQVDSATLLEGATTAPKVTAPKVKVIKADKPRTEIKSLKKDTKIMTLADRIRSQASYVELEEDDMETEKIVTTSNIKLDADDLPPFPLA